MSNIGIEQINTAERIALPKGENNEQYILDFQEFTGIEVPVPPEGKLSAKSEGRSFFWLRGIDIPEKVDLGLVDVGVAGTDALWDYDGFESLTSKTIGEAVCRFSVLTAPEDVENFSNIFKAERRYAVPVATIPTSRPRALERFSEWADYPLRADKLSISGSVEVYAELMSVRAVADIVKTGTQAKANGLTEAEKLFDISAETIMSERVLSKLS